MNDKIRRPLYLLVEGLPEAQRPVPAPEENAEVFALTEANAAEALRKIFAAGAISVWGDVK